MSQKSRKKRQRFSEDFKQKAIELAKEIGAKQAAEKLGIESHQTLGAWVRYSKKVEENQDFREAEELRAEVKSLRKQLDEEKKAVEILRAATAFFCQKQGK